MTLRGSLRELSLAEVLQMASLSRKPGVLSLRAARGSARLGLEAGAVVRVAREDPAPADALETLIGLFEWTDGEFHLDARADPRGEWPGGAGEWLDPPLEIQGLVLEVARRAPAAPSGPRTEPPACALIAVGPDLNRLEQLKRAASARIERVHICQLPADAMRRAGSYLAEGRFPVVVLDVGASGWHADAGWPAIAERLRGLSAQIRLVAFGEAESGTWAGETLPCPADDASLARLLGLD